MFPGQPNRLPEWRLRAINRYAGWRRP
jgi:hypothetical protein